MCYAYYAGFLVKILKISFSYFTNQNIFISFAEIIILESTLLMTASNTSLSFLRELEIYSNDDWDSAGAKSVKNATINNCNKILSVASSFRCLLTSVYSTELGTICLQWHNFANDNLVNVEVSPDKMAFYFDSPKDGLSNFPPVKFDDSALHKFSTIISQI